MAVSATEEWDQALIKQIKHKEHIQWSNWTISWLDYRWFRKIIPSSIWVHRLKKSLVIDWYFLWNDVILVEYKTQGVNAFQSNWKNSLYNKSELSGMQRL